MGDTPDTRRSLTVVPLIDDKRYYGEAPGRPTGSSGEGRRYRGLDDWGCQAGLGWAAETREKDKGPEPGHCLARDPSGKPSNHSIGESDELLEGH